MKILFLGGGYTTHLMVVAHAIKLNDPSINIEWCSLENKPEKFGFEFKFPIDNVYTLSRRYASVLYKIPIIRRFLFVSDYRRLIEAVPYKDYDLVILHFVRPLHLCVIDKAKRLGKQLIEVPWGSDIYRVKRDEIKKMKTLLSKADYITAINDKMKYEIIEKFQIPQSRVVTIPVVGSVACDDIINSPEITREIAKERLGVSRCFTIVCGTLANAEQNHIKIIESLRSIKEQLPKNTILMFLLGRDPVYDKKVVDYAEMSGFRYKFFNRRITSEEMLLWRKATDVLIHAQPTDSESLSIKEALLCDSIIVNASWLTYPVLEQYGKPYYTFEKFEDLGKIVLHAIKNNTLNKTAQLVEYLESWTMRNVAKQSLDFYRRILSRNKNEE